MLDLDRDHAIVARNARTLDRVDAAISFVLHLVFTLLLIAGGVWALLLWLEPCATAADGTATLCMGLLPLVRRRGAMPVTTPTRTLRGLLCETARAAVDGVRLRLRRAYIHHRIRAAELDLQILADYERAVPAQAAITRATIEILRVQLADCELALRRS